MEVAQTKQQPLSKKNLHPKLLLTIFHLKTILLKAID